MSQRIIGKQKVWVEVKEHYCDGCKRAFTLDLSNKKDDEIVDWDGTVILNFGYNSKHDTGRAKFDLCQDCAGRVWHLIHNQFPHMELTYDS